MSPIKSNFTPTEWFKNFYFIVNQSVSNKNLVVLITAKFLLILFMGNNALIILKRGLFLFCTKWLREKAWPTIELKNTTLWFFICLWMDCILPYTITECLFCLQIRSSIVKNGSDTHIPIMHSFIKSYLIFLGGYSLLPAPLQTWEGLVQNALTAPYEGHV